MCYTNGVNSVNNMGEEGCVDAFWGFLEVLLSIGL